MTTPRMKAAAKGESTYEGQPCKTCGSTLRYTINASCISCINEKSKVHSKEHRAKIKALLEQAKAGA